MQVATVAASVIVLTLALPGLRPPAWAQTAPPGSPAARATDRIRALQREAEALAGQERTLLGALRALEVERDLRAEEARKLDVEVGAVAQQIEDATRTMASLDEAIQAARPALDARLVDVYKLGRPGYARVLLGVSDLRDIGRATRMLSALAQIDQRRVQAFTTDLARLAAAKTTIEQQSIRLRGLQADARKTAGLAARAAADREALVRKIDARRDLNAQMVGELEVATERLQRAVRSLPGTSAAPEPVVLPLKPFRGALDWPIAGRVLSRFGERHNPRFGTTTTQKGLEIESADGSPVRSIHDGTVAFADVFAGFGQLVIVDHGGLAFTLYGYLGSMTATKGMRVSHGQVIGTAGRAPAGHSALYFELRIDGVPVDPLQWLKER